MDPLPLPDFLADLQLSLAGKPLALHPVSWDQGMYAVALDAPEGSWGLFVDLEQERGRHHDSQTVEEYKQGSVYGHVRSLHDHVGTPKAFEDWLRERVTKLIHQLVGRHIDGTYDRLEQEGVAATASTLAAMCHEIAALPPLPKVEPFGCQPICDALAAILKAHERGTMQDDEAATVRFFLDEYNEPAFRKHLRDQTIRHAFVLLPDVIPHPVRDYLEASAREQFDKYTNGSKLTVENTASIGRLLELQPAHLRPIYNDFIVPRCDNAALCFAMATTLSADPAVAARYAEMGRQHEPTHVGLSRFTEILRTHPTAFQEAADQAKAYEALWPKVLNEANTSDLQGNDEKLLEVEAWLNRFWMELLPPRHDPSWEEIVETLCAQVRFKARGSEAYLTWCRYQGREDEGVDYFLRCVDDLDRTQLQHRSDWHCGPYLAQAFSCMLDTQRPEHIEQALEVIARLESVLTWKNQHVFYALACIASRAGQLERALGYAKQSVDLGHDAAPMLTDPDFNNLMADPHSESILRAMQQER